MTRVQLLYDLKNVCADAVKDMPMPQAVQKGDKTQKVRAPEIFLMRLPSKDSTYKYVPYIILQIINSAHIQKPGKDPIYKVWIRFVFCVYNEDGQEGGIMLLNVMDRVQERLLKSCTVGRCFFLDVSEPLESVIYPEDNTAPFFGGEMVCGFVVPAIEREVDIYGAKGKTRHW